MKKKALAKEFHMEIKHTFLRFLCIFLIVALGVAFFTGIRATEPNMKLSADHFFDENNMMDIRILGGLGLTQSDVEATRLIDGVKEVMPAYSFDVFQRQHEALSVLRLLSMPDLINLVSLQEGRMPEKYNECLIDTKLTSHNNYQIGDVIHIESGTEDDIKESLNCVDYTIVGSCTTPYYLSVERGTSKIGSGSVNGFVMIPKENFVLEAYTELYVSVDGAKELLSFSDEYADRVDAIVNKIEAIAEERSVIRYLEVKEEAGQKITDARAELADAKQEADEKLSDARSKIKEADKKIADAKKDAQEGRKSISDGKKELEDGYAKVLEGKLKLADAERELKDGRKELDKKIQEFRDAKKKIQDAEAELKRGWEELTLQEKKLADGVKAWEAGEKERREQQAILKAGKTALSDAIEKIGQSQTELIEGRSALEAGSKELEQKRTALDQQKAELKLQRLQLEQAEKLSGTVLFEERNKLLQAEAMIAAAEPDIAAAEAALAETEKRLDAGESALAAGKAEIEKKKEELKQGDKALLEAQYKLAGSKKVLEDSDKKITKARQKLEEGDQELTERKADLEEGGSKLDQAKKVLEDGELALAAAKQKLAGSIDELTDGEAEIALAKEKLEEGEKQLREGERELQENKQKLLDAEKEAEEKIKDADVKISDAEKKVSDIEVPKWHVLDRDSLQVYVEYGQNAKRIGAIGDVFPVLFFLVALLVSLTTMTRMVEEERTQIGTLKALGYGKWVIISKYLLYALLASLLGSILGAILGQKLLPYIIQDAYRILYTNIPYLLSPVNPWLGLGAAAIACGCTALAAMLSCYRVLVSSAADLMRPVSPKAGKRVLLERVSFIWKRLKFAHKASVRNLFRYKKRFFMTIFGIGGCMALLLVGFGLLDSVYAIMNNQYETIILYNGSVSLDTSASAKELKELEAAMDSHENIKDFLPMHQSYSDVGFGEAQKEAILVVPVEGDHFSEYISLQNRTSGELYRLSNEDDGVYLTEKLAKLLGVSVGDTIYLKDSDLGRYDTKVNGITENYLFHYVYLSAGLYERIYGNPPEYNAMFFIAEDTSSEMEKQFGEDILKHNAAIGVSFNTGAAKSITDMMESMNVVIYVLIISAGMLAFIVLYNLNNININERRRELATIKVLGFYNGELSAYVYRENIMLTAIGIILGAIMGKLLHLYVVLTAEIDITMFGRKIEPFSFLYSILFTILFSAIVNWVMYYRLKKIDMVESLKSIE